LPRDGAHLLIDVILAYSLRKSPQLTLDIGGILTLKGRRTELIAAGPMTARTRGDAPLRIAGKYQALANIALLKTAAAFRKPYAGVCVKPPRRTISGKRIVRSDSRTSRS
jgi:hypothetical protein